MFKVSLDQFRLSRNGKTLVSNLSDLDENKNPFWLNDRMEFIVVSPFTKREMTWSLSKIYKNSDNEIARWEFVPSEETIKKHPKISRNQLIIFNV